MVQKVECLKTVGEVHTNSSQAVDIAPTFRKMISLMPAEELTRMQQCFGRAEAKGIMTELMLLDVEKEIRGRSEG